MFPKDCKDKSQHTCENVISSQSKSNFNHSQVIIENFLFYSKLEIKHTRTEIKTISNTIYNISLVKSPQII